MVEVAVLTAADYALFTLFLFLFMPLYDLVVVKDSSSCKADFLNQELRRSVLNMPCDITNLTALRLSNSFAHLESHRQMSEELLLNDCEAI